MIVVPIDQLPSILPRVVIPIYVPDNRGRPVVCGSAILVRVGEHYVLATAGHVIATNELEQRTLYMFPNRVQTPLVANWFTTIGKHADHQDDRLDIAVAEIGGGFCDDTAYEFLDASRLDPDFRGRAYGDFCVQGFPSTATKVNNYQNKIKEKALYWRSAEADVAAYRIRPFHRESHILIPYSKEEFVTVGVGKQHGPDLPGISGGAVWALPPVDEYGHIDYEKLKLVGVPIEYLQNEGVIVATNIGVLCSLLVKMFPNIVGSVPMPTRANYPGTMVDFPRSFD